MSIINGRGFGEFIGETITCVDTTAINVVHFHTKSGKIISVDADVSHHGFPVVQVNDWEQSAKASDELTWEQLVPTHIADFNLYAKFEGVWQCFYDGWKLANNRSEKFFESISYEPDDSKLRPL